VKAVLREIRKIPRAATESVIRSTVIPVGKILLLPVLTQIGEWQHDDRQPRPRLRAALRNTLDGGVRVGVRLHHRCGKAVPVSGDGPDAAALLCVVIENVARLGNFARSDWLLQPPFPARRP
jgi:hypothetical protein